MKQKYIYRDLYFDVNFNYQKWKPKVEEKPTSIALIIAGNHRDLNLCPARDFVGHTTTHI